MVDDVIIELSADLEAATKAQTEPVLKPKRPGNGLAAVRQYIEAAFAPARKHTPQLLCDVDVVETTPRKPRAIKVAKSLAEKAEIIFKDCDTHHHTPVRRAGIHRCYHVAVPRESAGELFSQALKSLSRKERP
jgi:hypothetical protein